MRKFAIAAALAALVATPAFAAGQGRGEVRGGIAFAGGSEEAFAGVALGYDFDLGERAFVGIEGSADKVLVDGSDVLFGIAARAGVKAGENTRVYALGGYGFADNQDDPFIGAGVEFGLGGRAYGKVEYRRVLISNFTDVNFAGVGVGLRF